MSLTRGFYGETADEKFTSAQFAEIFHTLIGDGVTDYGGKFSITVGGFNTTLSSGYALAAGRWLENDENYVLSVPLPDNAQDRTDALVVRVDYAKKKAALEVLVNVDEAAIRADPSAFRSSSEYSVFLYFIRVRRGATSLSVLDITDTREDSALCGPIKPLSELSASVLYVYRYLTTGIDAELDRLSAAMDAVTDRAEAAAISLDNAIKGADGMPAIGDTTTSITPPTPENEWLLCNGGTVPAAYPALSTLLNGTLPNIPTFDSIAKMYIYGGTPATTNNRPN